MLFENIRDILTLNREAIRKVADSPEGTTGAFLTILMTGCIAGLFSVLFVMSSASEAASLGFFVAILILPMIIAFMIAGVSIASVFFHLIAKLFGGKGSIVKLFRVFGHAQALSVLSWIPFINIFVSIYGVVVNVVALSEVEGLSTPKAALVILIPLIIGFILLFTFFLFILTALAGGVASGAVSLL